MCVFMKVGSSSFVRLGLTTRRPSSAPQPKTTSGSPSARATGGDTQAQPPPMFRKDHEAEVNRNQKPQTAFAICGFLVTNRERSSVNQVSLLPFSLSAIVESRQP